MDIKGVKKISAVHYFSNARIVKVKIKEDKSQVIKAISSNESAFVRKNHDKFVFPTVTIDSVKVSEVDKQKVEDMLIDISNSTNTDFIEDCFDVLSTGETHTKLVQEKISTMIDKLAKRAEITEQVEPEREQSIETKTRIVENSIEPAVVEIIESQISDGPKEMKIEERNPLDVVYDGIGDEVEAKTIEHLDDLTSYEVSYV